MKELRVNKILVIPDVHQCIGGFVEPILAKEKDWDFVVFLGDWIDCFESPDNKQYYTVAKTCEWINEHFKKFGNKAVWLMGNHDLSYVSTFIPNRYQVEKTFGYICSGWSSTKAKEFNKSINPEWVYSLELCCMAGNYILSHAGFHVNHFKPFLSPLDNIRALYDAWETDKRHFKRQAFHWIGRVGLCRGGMDDVGSPVWLDWDLEFQPIEKIDQIVGHTNSMELHKPKKGKNSINYCIDTYRSCYAIIQNDKTCIKTL